MSKDFRDNSLVNYSRELMGADSEGKVRLSGHAKKIVRDYLAQKAGEKIRPASDIIREFGDPECPADTPPSPELFREARLALGT